MKNRTFVQMMLIAAIATGAATPSRLAHAAKPAAKPAATPQPMPLATSLPPAAKTQWEAGRAMYTNAKNAHDYQTALDNFLVAYDLSKDARLFWYVAACEKELGDRPAASEAAHRYLAEGKLQPADHQLTEKERQQGQALIDLLAPYVTTVTITASEDGVALAIDNHAVGTSPLPKPVYIEVGHRVLHASKAGLKAVDEPFEAINTAGEAPTPLSVTLVPDTGTVRIDVDANAAIEVDEKLVGTGHADVTIAAGSHRLHFAAKGKVSRDETIQVASGSTQTLAYTLTDTSSGVPAWVWIAGGVVVAGGLSIAGYEIFKPSDKQGTVPSGSLGEITASSFRFH